MMNKPAGGRDSVSDIGDLASAPDSSLLCFVLRGFSFPPNQPRSCDLLTPLASTLNIFTQIHSSRSLYPTMTIPDKAGCKIMRSSLPFHPSVSGGHLICVGLSALIMCSVTVAVEGGTNVSERSCRSIPPPLCPSGPGTLISITPVNRIQRTVIKGASNGSFPIL